MQFIVNQMIGNLAKKDYFITVLPTNYPIARASGFSGESVGLPTSGIIYVHEQSLTNYTDQEITFILAHELSHIINSHVLSRIWWHMIEQLSVLGVSVFAKTSMEASVISATSNCELMIGTVDQ